MPYRAMVRAALLSTMLSSFAGAAFGQPSPPPGIEEALRARVTQFFQYHVDGNFRGAYEMVAEDTKDFYFKALKIQFKSFQILGIRFSDNFTRAAVDLNTDQEIRRPEFPSTVVPIPMTTFWQLENDKWVWHRDADADHLTPMGSSDVNKIRDYVNVSPQDLQKMVTPEEIQRRAADILHQGGIDKQEVTFATDKRSTAKVTFHNGQSGTVKVMIAPGKSLPGFSTALDKADVGPNENAVLTIAYDPLAMQKAMPPVGVVRLIVEPFDQTFDVTVKFLDPPAANQ